MSDCLITEASYTTEITPSQKHYHMSYQLIYIVNGRVRVKVNQHIYEVGGNTIILINCFEEHSIEILSDVYERYLVTFSKEKIDKLIDDPQIVSILGNRPAGFRHCVDAPAGASQAFLSFINEYRNPPDSFSQEAVSCALKSLLIEIFRKNKESFPFIARQIKPAIFEIKNYLDNHFTDNIQISLLAEKFFINKYYLSHAFKEAVGYSPKQYLLLNRLSYAKQLLINSELNILQVALESGFRDANSFIRAFKGEYAITPCRYRNSGRLPQ